jgi:hypothetical protein
MIFRFSPSAAAMFPSAAAVRPSAAALFAALAAFAAPGASFASPGDASARMAGAAAKNLNAEAVKSSDDRAHWRVEARKSDPKKEESKKADSKAQDSKKSDAKGETKGADQKKPGKPIQVGNYGDWGAYLAQSGKDKTCYALASPKDRAPGGLNRDPAYVFISNRPGENVRNEVSIIMGFALKEGADGRAEIGGSSFDLVAKGSNAWIKNPAEESQFIDALKKGSKLIVKAPSQKGRVTIDTYSLSGISQALERVQKDCP